MWMDVDLTNANIVSWKPSSANGLCKSQQRDLETKNTLAMI
jgi:hypothetical protein